MRSKQAIIIEKPPKHYEEGGLFYVDLQVDGLPLLVFRPHVLLKAIGGARIEYERWAFDGRAEVVQR